MKVKFWGVRGSIPSPGQGTVRYGGNTACVEVFCGDTLIILDAGSGIRMLGNDLLRRYQSPIQADILMSHFHWDHIQGFPFFVPAYIPGNRFTIHGCEGMIQPLEMIFKGQMVPDYFPISFQEMPSEKSFSKITEGDFEIKDVKISTLYLNHPGIALGYRLEHEGKVFCFISDNEPHSYSEGNGAGANLLEEIRNGEVKLGPMDEALIEFIQGAHLLVHDSQYSVEEYVAKIGWGHSFFQFAIEIGVRANVQRLLLFHHDPMRDDDMVDRMAADCNALISEKNISLRCQPAAEGMEFEL
ncbi:MAG: MBL fold metallo-hydrolase [Planctomycetota bacterium]|nr:MBL fold metallo-hydrolase [Planctomycetota bacterium]